MKIGFLFHTFSPAPMIGPIRHTHALAKGLARRGNEVAIITSLADAPQSTSLEETEQGVRIIRLPVSVRLGHWIVSASLKPTLSRERFDVIHAQGYRNYFTEAGSSYAKATGTPFFVTPRGSLLGYRHLAEGRRRELPNILYDLATRRRALRNAILVVSSTQEGLDAHELGIPPQRVELIPYGIDFEEMALGMTSTRRTGSKLIFVGRIAYQRNLEFLIRGFGIAAAKQPKLSLTIVGDRIPSRYNRLEMNYPKKLARLVEELGLKDRVLFPGPRYGPALWGDFGKSDIFVYTSRYDNFGHALVEAAYFGLPIISTEVGVAPDLIAEGRGGILVGQDDDEALADAIIYASSNPEWRQTAGSFLMERARRYDLESNARAHENLYRRVLARGA